MTATLLSASEYLKTEFRPDADFVDGLIEERNVGEKSHGKMQVRLVLLLREMGLFATLETRLKVSATRYRVPDVCAYHEEPDEEVFTDPPYICIEVLSPEDRIVRTMEVAHDYFRIGVQNVWLVDPVGKMIYICDAAGGWSAVTDATVQTCDERLVLTVSQILG
jgi:Uma2 family endonuclease